MEKKSQLDDVQDDADMAMAREVLQMAVQELSTFVPALTLLAATGELLAHVAAVVMAIDQQRNGSTKQSLAATLDLLRLLRDRCEQHAAEALGRPLGRSVH